MDRLRASLPSPERWKNKSVLAAPSEERSVKSDLQNSRLKRKPQEKSLTKRRSKRSKRKRRKT